MRCLFSLVILIFTNIYLFAQEDSNLDKTIFKTDLEGKIISGSVDQLVKEIQQGAEIRVGWQHDLDKDGEPDLEHWIDANFISILGGHVFTQIDPIYRQSPKMEVPQVEITTSEMKWTGIIGTNGKLVSRYIIPNMDKLLENTSDEKLIQKLMKQVELRERIVSTIWVAR